MTVMKVLAITNLFPNIVEPGRGVFNKQQFSELSKLCDLKVVAPIPIYKNRSVPKRGSIDGIETFYPRYFMTPKVLRSLYGYFYYLSLRNTIIKIKKIWPFDIILTAWAFPDGFGSQLIAKELKVPCVIMVLGSDINIQTNYLLRKRMIVNSLNAVSMVISVSKTLKTRMIDIGVREDKITVVTNGINKDIFRPFSSFEARHALNLPHDAKIVLFAGNLVQGKGAELIVEAFPEIINKEAKALLVIAGDGKMKKTLMTRVAKLGITNRVIFVGRQSHESMPKYMNASNVFCLPSASEGCPNVILEALSCSVPIVGSDIPAIAEILEGSKNAILSPVGNVSVLSQSVLKLLSVHKDMIIPEDDRTMSWQENATIVYRLFETIVNN